MNEIAKLVVLSVAATVFTVLLASIIAYPITVLDCWSSWSGTKLEYRVNFLTCQVRDPQAGWIPEKNYRGVAQVQE